MAKQNKSNEVQSELAVEKNENNTKTWLKRPDWELSFKNRMAIINGVSDEDFALLSEDDNKGFAKQLVEWVANNSGKLKVSRYQIKGGVYNIGTRGPGPEDSIKNPFKMRVVKASKEAGEKGIKVVTREVTTQDVVQFILSGRLDASVFKTALDEVKQQRLAQIQKLQAEIAGLNSWEQLANVDASSLSKLMSGAH